MTQVEKAEALATVRVYATQFARARQDRDQAVRDARALGLSLRRIAKASDLSKDAVQAILNRR